TDLAGTFGFREPEVRALLSASEIKGLARFIGLDLPRNRNWEHDGKIRAGRRTNGRPSPAAAAASYERPGCGRGHARVPSDADRINFPSCMDRLIPSPYRRPAPRPARPTSRRHAS